jgi:hypothetical protein
MSSEKGKQTTLAFYQGLAKELVFVVLPLKRIKLKKPKKEPEKSPEELLEIKKRNCRYFLIKRLLEENVEASVLQKELEQFGEVGPKIFWGMQNNNVVYKIDLPNSHNCEEYYWGLNILHSSLTNPWSKYYFPDLVDKIMKLREENENFFARLKSQNA